MTLTYKLIFIIASFATIFAGLLFSSSAHLGTQARVTSTHQITSDGFVKTNLAADGVFLYFTEITGKDSFISKLTLKNGALSKFADISSNLRLLDVSAFRSQLLAAQGSSGSSSENHLLVSPLQNPRFQHFGNVQANEAIFAPDGTHLLVTKDSNLFLTDADGTATTEIAHVQGTPYFARFSPDGSRIRFSVGDINTNTSSLWEVKPDGTGLRVLFPGWRNVSSMCCGSWSGDGRYYIFQATESALGSTGNLFAAKESSHSSEGKAFIEPVRLTEGSVSFSDPVSSKDGTKLWSLGLKIRGSVVKFEPKSESYIPFLEGISATDLDFSADGEWITYTSIPDGTLWRARYDGTSRQQLTSAPGRAALPRWSPDGKQIAYIRIEPGQPWAIFIVPANGGQSRRLLPEKLTQIDVNWSKDGERIIFGRVTQHTSDGLNILSFDLKTGKLTTIPGSEGLFSPRVSPDGRYIAAITGDLTKLKLYDSIVNTWSDWQTLESGAVNYPVWSSDSKSIYFDDLISGEGAYCRAQVGKHRFEQVFVQAGIERYLGPFGPWSGRTPDGSVLFVQEASVREVYELGIDLP
jgi:Tol biopolymer transport system component